MTSNYFRFFNLHEFLIPPFRCFANYCKQSILMIVLYSSHLLEKKGEMLKFVKGASR